MTDSPTSPYARLRPWIIITIAWVVAFDIAWAWQRVSGAHTNEFGEHPSEARHYLTSLMLRDYAVSGHASSPRAFAGRYIAHYPIADLHLNPPFFHALEGGWMLLAGTSRTSAMLLMAALAATGATLVFGALRREFRNGFAAMGGLTFLCLPMVRESYGMLMPEVLAGALILGGALIWGRYLERERTADAIGFGILTILALLTDVSAWALLVQAPVTALLAGKTKLFSRPATWAALVLPVIVCGPANWFLSQRGVEKGHAYFAGWSAASVRDGLIFYPGKLGLGLGIVLLLFFALGLMQQLRGHQAHAKYWTIVAITLGIAIALIIFLPVQSDARRLVSLLPMAVMFAIAGLARLAHKKPAPGADTATLAKIPLKQHVAAWVVAIVGILTAQWLARFEFGKRFSGYADAAQQILENASTPGQRILISSDATGEGALISAIAMREQRPGHVIKRANLELERVDRIRGGKHSRFETGDELATWFSRSEITYVAVDQSISEADRSEAHDQLLRAAEDHPEVFWSVARTSINRGDRETPGQFTLYRVKGRGN